MKLVLELLKYSKIAKGNDILNFLTKIPNIPFENVLAHKFREATFPNRHMTVLWYSQGSQILLIGVEHHIKDRDYLADEEPFNEQPPFYFSECDHYTSPIYQLELLREKVTKLLKPQGLLGSAIWIVYVTNNHIINKEEMQDDVWLPRRVIVFDDAQDLTPDFCVESIPEMQHGMDVFQYAYDNTDWEYFEFPQMNDEIEEEIEKETEEDTDVNLDTSPKESRQLFNFDPDDFDLNWTPGNKLPFSKENDPVYVPKMEDGLRAEVHPRIENPEEVFKGLVGCQEIKEQIRQLTTLHRYNQKMQEYNPDAQVHDIFLHAIFHGSPGTGKTTLCQLYASLLYKAGALTHGHVVVATRSTFLGTNFGDEEKAVHAVLEAAKGGVLMIDEAYQLNPPHPNDPGKNVLQLMMPVLADEHTRDMAIVLCGYSEPMEKLLNLNEGLASRFPNRFKFPDFTISQLLEISKLRIKKFNYHFTPKAWKLYKEVVSNAYLNRDKKTWGNAREVSNILEKIYIHHANRYMRAPNPKKMFVITVADIKPVEKGITPNKKHCIGFR